MSRHLASCWLNKMLGSANIKSSIVFWQDPTWKDVSIQKKVDLKNLNFDFVPRGGIFAKVGSAYFLLSKDNRF